MDLLLGSVKFGPSPLLSKTDNLPLPCCIKKKDDKIIDPRRVDFSRRRVKTAHTRLESLSAPAFVDEYLPLLSSPAAAVSRTCAQHPCWDVKRTGARSENGSASVTEFVAFISLFGGRIMQPSISFAKAASQFPMGVYVC